MSEDTLFDDKSTDGVVADTTPAPTFELPAGMEELIGEGKKYADVATALGSIGPAQAHIEKLEAEAEQMRAELAKSTKLDDVLAKFGTNESTDSGKTTPQAVDPETILEALEARLAQKEQVNQNKANLGSVKAKLVEVYGEKAGETFHKAATSLGMTPQALTKLAAESPVAVLNLIGVPKVDAPSSSNSDVNTEALRDQGEPKAHKNIMYGATSADIMSEWRASAPKT